MNINKSHTRIWTNRILWRVTSDRSGKTSLKGSRVITTLFCFLLFFCKTITKWEKKGPSFLLLAYHLYMAVTAFSSATQASGTRAALSQCPANALPGNLQPMPVKCLCPRWMQPSATGSGYPWAGVETMMTGMMWKLNFLNAKIFKFGKGPRKAS